MDLCLIVINFCLLSACTHVADYKMEIAEMRSTPFILPLSEMNCIVDGVDSLFLVNPSGMKYVVYSDTSSCSYCDLGKVRKWENVLKSSEKYSDALDFYFIFSPTPEKYLDFKIQLKILEMHFPIYVDTLGLFERSNPHLSSNPAMHTFLLDEDNNVLLVGNPLENKKIEKLFWQIVEEKLGKRE